MTVIKKQYELEKNNTPAGFCSAKNGFIFLSKGLDFLLLLT